MNINVEKCDNCGSVNTAEPKSKWAAVASAGPRRIVLHFCPSCDGKVTVKDVMPKLNPPLPVRPARNQGRPVPVTVRQRPVVPQPKPSVGGPVTQTQVLP